MRSQILVVDDEESIRSVLDRLLQREGYSVLKATGGREALQLLSKEKPDLMILDLSLPDLPGEAVYESVRQDPRIRAMPILILTGRPAEGLTARCLNGGADAFLSKPFDNHELMAYVRALFRRSVAYVETGITIERGDLSIQPGERRIFLNGILMKHLSPKEYEVLKEIALQSPQVVTKEELAGKVWRSSLAQLHPRTLDVHIRRIRLKLGPAGISDLVTIPGIGYQWQSASRAFGEIRAKESLRR